MSFELTIPEIILNLTQIYILLYEYASAEPFLENHH